MTARERTTQSEPSSQSEHRTRNERSMRSEPGMQSEGTTRSEPAAQSELSLQSERAAQASAGPDAARQALSRRAGPAAGTVLDRCARRMVDTAARRWPDELSEVMADEWRGELEALRVEPGLRPGARAWRTLAFAGSIVLSPAVEAEGEEPASWFDRPSRSLAGSAGLTLLAAALFNGVHVAQHEFADRLPPVLGAVAAAVLLAVAAVVMVAIGAHSRAHAVWRTVLLGAGMFVFMLAGNRVAVMPFMGWADIAPAIVVWTTLSAATVVAVSRIAAAARGRLALLVGLAGSAIALDLGTVAGSLHAAVSLDVGFGSAPLWFPLALLPGGTAAFGTYFADGSAAFGSLQASGPAFHASEILLGNASAMAGPMILCSAFLLALALRSARLDGVASDAPVPDAFVAVHFGEARAEHAGPVQLPDVSGRTEATEPAPTVGATDQAHQTEATNQARQAEAGDRTLVGGAAQTLARRAGRTLMGRLPNGRRPPDAGRLRTLGRVLPWIAGLDLRIAFGVGAALGGLAAADLVRRADAGADTTLYRLVDNSNVFGFGFLAETPGRVAVALLAGLLAAHLSDPLRRRFAQHS
ncbi:MAG TPA: hypothetical protein VGP57_03780 [Actinoplanes sp.]|nr:hypothetical protein [Actinoplanes sp.]